MPTGKLANIVPVAFHEAFPVKFGRLYETTRTTYENTKNKTKLNCYILCEESTSMKFISGAEVDKEIDWVSFIEVITKTKEKLLVI